MQDIEEIKPDLSLDITLSSVDQSYLIEPRIIVGQHIVSKLVRQSYIFFVLELRTGVDEDIIKNIMNQILESCEEIIQKGLSGISFIINGVHHPVKHLNIASIKQLLSNIMTITIEDDYFFTIQKTRHAIQTVSKKLDQAKVTLIFFFSYVKIDHSLGVKKRSYIDQLNEHSQQCLQQVKKLSKAIRTYTQQCKCYIISLDKLGEELQDYSLADTELMNQINLFVGNYGSTIYRNYSNNQISDSFKSVTALLLNQLYSVNLFLPIIDQLKKQLSFYLSCNDLKQFKPYRDIFMHKTKFDLDGVKQGKVYLTDVKKIEDKVGEVNLIPNIVWKELQLTQLVIARAQLYNEQLGQISWKLSKEIVSYKRRYELGKSYLIMNINENLLLDLRGRVDRIYDISKQIYTSIFENNFKNKHMLFEHYNQLKTKIDTIQQILLGVFKKRIGGSQIGKLSQLINLGTIKRALKNKLIRRINANPYLLDQVYRNIEDIVDNKMINFIDLETNTQQIRSDLGNCVLSDCNFVKAMQAYDAMGISFELQRPESAIADPGRIKIRQVSPFAMRTSQFFEKFIYKINYTPEMVNITLGACAICRRYNCYLIKHNIPTPRIIQSHQVPKYKTQTVKVKQIQWNKDASSNSFDEQLSPNQRLVSDILFQTRQIDYLRDKGQLQKSNYSQRCDYTDRVGRTPTVLGFIPLFLTKEHWLVAKQLMKPCLGWTATGEPLGYLFSQYQVIPFLVLSNLIRTCKQRQYALEQEYKNVDACKNQKELNELQSKINLMKQRLQRFKILLRATQQTCKYILIELSQEKYQNKMLDLIKKQYLDYSRPINRTIDIISNNSAFISQLYCAFNNELLPKPNEQEFHDFFIRLIEEELRRQTDGWNQQQVQDKFVDKLLNVQVSGIKNWKFNILGGEQYLQKFNAAIEGYQVQRNTVELQRQQLDMILKKGGKFNDSQRLILIEYKRLYENRALWFWYVRFLLYGQVERIKIHKWKCLNLNNSYMLFTLIIQNKKQRKNYKRRQAILQGDYIDPFDYPEAYKFLFYQFVKLRAKKEGEVLKTYNTKVCNRAAQLFSLTGRLQQAAGTLINFNMNSIKSFYDELARGKAVRIDEKLKMFFEGRYRGVRLFNGWKMSKKRYLKLSKIYPVEFMKYQYKF